MNPHEDRIATREERVREIQRKINAYHRVFLSPDGKLILDDLSESFGIDKPAFIATASGKFDPIQAAIRDGQRSVILHILHQLNLAIKGDDEAAENAPKVIS